MFFREIPGFNRMIEGCAGERFLKEACRKYHYLPEDWPGIKQTAENIQASIREEAFFRHSVFQEKDGLKAGVVMTLGRGVDTLQEGCDKAGKLSESYMIEMLSGEILMQAYGAYHLWVAENTPYHVAGYYFLGSDSDYPMELLPELLKKLKAPVSCNEGYCMIPKKSVAFYALLTEDEKITCQGICTGCGRKDCQNKMKEIRPLPYGYARILGKDYV